MPKSLSIKLSIFFLVFLTISFASYFLVTNSLKHEKSYSHIINEAGKERMLIEKINKKAIQLIYMDDPSAKQELEYAGNEFESILNGLYIDNDNQYRNDTPLKDIQGQLRKIKQQWQSLKLDLDQVVAGYGDEAITIQQINKKSDEMIRLLEFLVDSIESEGIEASRGLTVENTILILLNLLFAIVLFITWRLLKVMSKSKRKYRLLVDHSPIGIMMCKENELKYINQFARQCLGYSQENDIVGKSIFAFIHYDYHELVTFRLNNVDKNQQVTDLIEQKWVKKNGETIDVEVMSLPFNIMDDNVNLVIFRDITEKKRSENKYEDVYKELIDIKEALDESSIIEITDSNGIIQYVNNKFCDISKYKPEEVIGKTHRILQSGYHSPQFYKNLWDTILSGHVWKGEVKNKAKDGSYYWVQTTILPFISKNGELYQFLTIRNDITDIKEAEQEINLLATKDHLTHLFNRGTFEHKLQEEIERQKSVAVFFLDLDRFKYINDSLGHSSGDELLKLVSKRLRKIVGKDAIVSRLGGDEFTIIVKNGDHEELSTLATKIIEGIKQPFNINHKELLITCSIGISIYPDHGKDIGTLMKNADAAMYWTKENGKDGFSIYQDFMKEGSAEIMQLEWELRKAIENKEFTLYYQPKLDLFTKEVIGSEVLIRWNHPKKGFISPEEFIPLAEETGLINQIGEMVLRVACKQNKVWHQAGYSEFQVAVNLSVHQLKQANIVDVIASILKETELEPRLLELEITESISLLADETQIQKLFALKELGISLAIDDFGTGYSSLKYLDKLPFNTLKIDKSFIDEIGKSNHFASSLMTNAIISLAKSLNLEVVAEGIETREQMNYLNKHQCDIGQGYFISKPLPADELEVFLKSYSESLRVSSQ